MKLLPSSRQRFSLFLRGRRKAGVQAQGSKDLQKKQAELSTRNRCLNWVPNYKFTAACILACAFLSLLTGLAQPLLSRHIIDDVLMSQYLSKSVKIGELTKFVGWMTIMLLSTVTFDVWQNRLIAQMNAKLVVRARRALFHHILRLPLHTLNNLKLGGITSLLNSDVSTLGNLLEDGIFVPGVEGMRIFVTLIIIFSVNWRLALIAIIVIPVMVLLSFAFIHKLRPIYHAIFEESSAITSRVIEVASGIRIVRAYAREAFEELHHAVNNHFLVRTSLFADLLKRMIDSGWTIVVSIALLLCMAIGSYLIINGTATVGDLTAVSMYIPIVIGPVFRLVNSQNQVQNSLAASERIFSLLDQEVDFPDKADAQVAPRLIRTIDFDDLSFGYHRDRLILRNINLHIKAGSLVALVGRSGSGKTTLTNLLARFYEPTAGCIRLNGIDTARFGQRSYRRLFGIVDQDVFLFDGTVKENISMGNGATSDEAIVAAAKLASAHDFISALPYGYDTVIGERAYTLSGGQRQRLSIARAFLADSQILILDEATSSLDTESEQRIQSALRELMKGRTTFVIAHRLSTITGADLILVLDDGAVQEQGTHSELVAAKGLYWQMVKDQLSFA